MSTTTTTPTNPNALRWTMEEITRRMKTGTHDMLSNCFMVGGRTIVFTEGAVRTANETRHAIQTILDSFTEEQDNLEKAAPTWTVADLIVRRQYIARLRELFTGDIAPYPTRGKIQIYGYDVPLNEENGGAANAAGVAIERVIQRVFQDFESRTASAIATTPSSVEEGAPANDGAAASAPVVLAAAGTVRHAELTDAEKALAAALDESFAKFTDDVLKLRTQYGLSDIVIAVSGVIDPAVPGRISIRATADGSAGNILLLSDVVTQQAMKERAKRTVKRLAEIKAAASAQPKNEGAAPATAVVDA